MHLPNPAPAPRALRGKPNGKLQLVFAGRVEPEKGLLEFLEALPDAFEGRLSVVGDGVDAMAFLRKQGEYDRASRPDLILLDLNLPRKSGREVIVEVKGDPTLKSIPIVVLTTSSAEQDVVSAYEGHANCYITKPVDLDQFIHIVTSIEQFWLTIVELPKE